MKKIYLLLFFLLFQQSLHAQIQDNTDSRLYLTCKVWGALKYFSQYKCSIKWDTLLNTTIKEVLVAPDNAGFNTAVLGMCNKVGNNTHRDDVPDLPDTNLNVHTEWKTNSLFSQSVKDFLNSFFTFSYPDTSTCLVQYNDYSDPNFNSLLDFRNDSVTVPVAPVDYTKETDRLLILFHHWNIINYYSPFTSIMDQPWDTTLLTFIPRIRQSTTTTAFLETFLKYQAKINDSHGFTNILLVSGTYSPKIYFERVGDKCVVKKVTVAGVSPGDILLAINRIDIKHIEDSLTESIAASTPAALYRDIYDQISWGASNSSIEYSLLDSNNNQIFITAKRNTSRSSWNSWSRDPKITSPYFVTKCGYGYVNMGMLESSDVSDMYDQFKNAPAIIFDLRNYPNGTLWDLAQYFFPSPIISARWFEPSIFLTGWYYKFDDGNNLGSWSNSEPYKGKIYILVNQETLSQAEYTCQYLSHAPTAKVIGTQTSGADGNVSYVVLPGGITTYFTSLGWYYDDWYQQQRNGVKIDSVVSPTIAGIRQGRDEILEAALDCVLDVAPGTASERLEVFPNPTNGIVNVYSPDITFENITIFNILGEKVLELDEPATSRSLIDLSELSSAVYIAKFRTADGKTMTRVIVKK